MILPRVLEEVEPTEAFKEAFEEAKLMQWLDGLREVKINSELGAMSDNDYALIQDRNGRKFCTETLASGEQVKIPVSMLP